VDASWAENCFEKTRRFSTTTQTDGVENQAKMKMTIEPPGLEFNSPIQSKFGILPNSYNAICE